MKLTRPSTLVIITLYVITIIFWFLFIITTKYTGTYEGWRFTYLLQPFLIGMTVIPLVGGIIGLRNAFNWGGVKSLMGRSSLALSLGLIAWAGGMIIWNYYLFFTTIEVPYPSLADAIFILSWPLWAYGLLQMSKVVGLLGISKHIPSKRTLFFVVGLAILISVYMSFGVARGWHIPLEDGTLTLFFDLFYPIGDVVILTLLTLVYWVSKKFLGGIYKFPILVLLFGFLLNYMSDFIFVFTTSQETYFNGHFVDFLYTTTMFVLSMGLAMLNPNILDSKQEKVSK